MSKKLYIIEGKGFEAEMSVLLIKHIEDEIEQKEKGPCAICSNAYKGSFCIVLP